jgi:hypothetical protein
MVPHQYLILFHLLVVAVQAVVVMSVAMVVLAVLAVEQVHIMECRIQVVLVIHLPSIHRKVIMAEMRQLDLVNFVAVVVAGLALLVVMGQGIKVVLEVMVLLQPLLVHQQHILAEAVDQVILAELQPLLVG